MSNFIKTNPSITSFLLLFFQMKCLDAVRSWRLQICTRTIFLLLLCNASGSCFRNWLTEVNTAVEVIRLLWSTNTLLLYLSTFFWYQYFTSLLILRLFTLTSHMLNANTCTFYFSHVEPKYLYFLLLTC